MLELFLKETVQFNCCLREIWFILCYKYLVARLINSDPCTLSNEGVMKMTQKLKFLETISNFKEDSLVTLVLLLFKVLAK